MGDNGEQRGGEGGKSGLLPDSIRKALVTGISAVFMTEEGIRNALSDMRLPKDAIAYLIQQTANSRRELARIVSDELRNLVKSADVSAALRKALAGLKLEVHAEIRFVDEGAEGKAIKISTSSEEMRAGRRRHQGQ